MCVCVCDLCTMPHSLYNTAWLPLCVTSCLVTIYFHSIMKSHANEYELKHLQFHFCLILSSFFFFPLLAVTTFPPALGLLPWGAGWCAGGFICWEGHVSWWWLSLSFSGSSDTNLDASVLTASLHCNTRPRRSINPSCNFIRISLLLHT